MRDNLLRLALLAPCLLTQACASNGSAGPQDGGPTSSYDGPTSSADGPTSSAPDMPKVGQLDGGIGDSGLPTLPALTNVVATEREDSVGIDFDPVDTAVDYRVYPLPKPGDVTVNADGSINIKNAVYRCAGVRQTYDLPNNTVNNLNNPDNGQKYENFNPQYSWTAEIPTNPMLGYVYVVPGTGLVPVYAVGVHPSTTELGWRESRPKIYTTSTTTRQTLLGQGGRDDGIVFYVPATASASTATVYYSETADPVGGQNWTQYTEYYFLEADMSMHATDTTAPTPAFQILTAAAAGTKPLMAVLYKPGMNHTELSVGPERFARASNQGPGPLWHLEWSGITEPTTLVVEALASGCPFQGLLSPQMLSAPPHQPLDTLTQLQAASATGEVFINGQYDLPGSSWLTVDFKPGTDGLATMKTPNASPIPLARSFIQVAPQPHNPADWDWYEGFGTTFATITPGTDPLCPCQVKGTPFPCQNGNGGCGYWTSSMLDIGAYLLDAPNNVSVLAYGQLFGQWWDVFDDTGQDVTGTLRFTAPKMANISADANTFLHVTWTVNIVGTDRRYPQLIVSDQPTPIQRGFANPDSNTLLVQTRQGPSMVLEAQAFHGLINGKPWAVNNQLPKPHSLVDYDNWQGSFNGIPSSATTAEIPPADSVFEHAGVDRMNKFDAYISANRLYVFEDGAPAGCTLFPTSGYALTGPVTVTFGDVLYHEGADDELVCAGPRPYAFLHEHQCTETVRHWDDLGYKAGVQPPTWDEKLFPCTAF